MIYGTVTLPGTFQSGPVLLTSITVTTAAQTLRIQPILMITGELTVVILGVTSSTNTSRLLRRNDYTLSGPGLKAFHPKSVTPVASSRLLKGEMEVVLKLPVTRRMLKQIKILNIAGTNDVIGK